MKRLFVMLSILFILSMPQAWAATATQYPNPYRQTMWNDMTDSIHTMGETPQQARMTRLKLHAVRAQTRLKGIEHAQSAQHKAKMAAWQASQNS